MELPPQSITSKKQQPSVLASSSWRIWVLAVWHLDSFDRGLLNRFWMWPGRSLTFKQLWLAWKQKSGKRLTRIIMHLLSVEFTSSPCWGCWMKMNQVGIIYQGEYRLNCLGYKEAIDKFKRVSSSRFTRYALVERAAEYSKFVCTSVTLSLDALTLCHGDLWVGS